MNGEAHGGLLTMRGQAIYINRSAALFDESTPYNGTW
jgi:hypothetical protein